MSQPATTALPTLDEARAMIPGSVTAARWDEGVLVRRMDEVEQEGGLIGELMPALRAKIEEQAGAERTKTVRINIARLTAILA